ncbi:hypothetical protein CSB69_3778 [Morganella morganii]|nr:hypothetical protein CSB69_3778 [Morganella morganii]
MTRFCDISRKLIKNLTILVRFFLCLSLQALQGYLRVETVFIR